MHENWEIKDLREFQIFQLNI